MEDLRWTRACAERTGSQGSLRVDEGARSSGTIAPHRPPARLMRRAGGGYSLGPGRTGVTGKTGEDVTREVSALEQRFQELLDFLHDALIEAVLPAGPITQLNRMARSLFGYTVDEVAQGLDPSVLFAHGEYSRILGLVDEYVGHSVATRTPYTRSGRRTSTRCG
jgi:PAS domain-containing protein